ncbi:BON domain-containing protein [Flagellatimonas centrodinii]|uniref:BON domain-containing protein n=1 Tax=Flagellatimonas centrodinii TaxID=2806210 RepID=UPI001FFC5013|nr:BON domain-containing protein [Flagellatimonas centrodinii]ULQ48015.1 BON domain-containing protein [Flagellatimonas centrodinii]
MALEDQPGHIAAPVLSSARSAAAILMMLSGAAVAADASSAALAQARQEIQIWTTYELNPHLRAHDLEVTVRNASATLSGIVDNDTSRDLATQIALSVAGIETVDNRITVQADYIPSTWAAGERRYGDVIDDATITAAIESKLRWSRNTEGLEALVDNRLVVSPQPPVEAERIVSTEHPRPAIAQGMTDVWITTRVKALYLYSRNVDNASISVSTDRGIVTLRGSMANGASGALAIELARNVGGVKQVQSRDLTP